MRMILTSLAFLAGILPAAASGGLDCSADDKTVKMEMHGGVTRGMGGPLFQFEGSVQITDKAVADDLRSTKFEMDHVAQYWFDDKALNLGLYRERDAEKAHGYVDVTIRTHPSDDEGSYVGTYEISVFDTTDSTSEPKDAKLSGKVECFTE